MTIASMTETAKAYDSVQAVACDYALNLRNETNARRENIINAAMMFIIPRDVVMAAGLQPNAEGDISNAKMRDFLVSFLPLKEQTKQIKENCLYHVERAREFAASLTQFHGANDYATIRKMLSARYDAYKKEADAFAAQTAKEKREANAIEKAARLQAEKDEQAAAAAAKRDAEAAAKETEITFNGEGFNVEDVVLILKNAGDVAALEGLIILASNAISELKRNSHPAALAA
jgi:hypothetical protein